MRRKFHLEINRRWLWIAMFGLVLVLLGISQQMQQARLEKMLATRIAEFQGSATADTAYWAAHARTPTPAATSTPAPTPIPFTLRIHPFNDINLDGFRGNPLEADDHLVPAVNPLDYSDVQFFPEEPIQDEDLRLCYEEKCFVLNDEGVIDLTLPLARFQEQGINLVIGGSRRYFTYNPQTAHLSELKPNALLLPQLYGYRIIHLGPSDLRLDEQNAAEIQMGFPPEACVMPLSSEFIEELSPMQFFDFDPRVGSVTIFNGEPALVYEDGEHVIPYNSDGHTGLDVAATRKDEIPVYYSCVNPGRVEISPSDSISGDGTTIEVFPIQSILYGHMSNVRLNRFDTVLFGDEIGKVSDIRNTPTHLHVSVKEFISGSYADIPIIPPGEAVQIDVSEPVTSFNQWGYEYRIAPYKHSPFVVLYDEAEHPYLVFIPTMGSFQRKAE